MLNLQYEYRADPNRRPQSPHPDSPREPEPYIAAPELIQAINLAIFLRRPLLLEGEAGCGKTRLARAVAYELGLPFYTWPVRSTSKAQDGLYSYDAILRLHDVQTSQLGLIAEDPASATDNVNKARQQDPRRPTDYRRFGALGKAFRMHEQPAVVLIDEIDKADVDFPNDLLSVLDDPWAFDIIETGEYIRADPHLRPIVIITSNKEKGNLPAPFLRRCIYYFLEFPNSVDRLRQIVDAHYRTRHENAPSDELVEASAKRFLKVRQDDALYKKPGTSEFLDWLRALHLFSAAQEINPSTLDSRTIPFRELLFKLRQDWYRATEIT